MSSFLAQVKYSTELISGGNRSSDSSNLAGTNLQALIDAQDTPSLPNTKIILVFSNRKAAYGLTRAAQANPPIPTSYLALQPFLKANPEKTRHDYDAAVARITLKDKPDLIILAGWMHILGDRFLELVDGRKPLESAEELGRSIPVINLHPALPGAFDGANAIERAYEAFQRGEITHSGAMVHRVVKDVDRGEPLIVKEVEMIKGEPIEAFAERLHKVEHEIIVQGAAKALNEVKPVEVSTFQQSSDSLPELSFVLRFNYVYRLEEHVDLFLMHT